MGAISCFDTGSHASAMSGNPFQNPPLQSQMPPFASSQGTFSYLSFSFILSINLANLSSAFPTQPVMPYSSGYPPAAAAAVQPNGQPFPFAAFPPNAFGQPQTNPFGTFPDASTAALQVFYIVSCLFFSLETFHL